MAACFQTKRLRFAGLKRLICGVLLIGSLSAACTHADEVKVSVYEGLPAKWDGKTPDRAADETWAAHALAFATLPNKYNSQAAITLRATPFLVVSQLERTYPAGAYQLYFRSRARTILRVDGKTLAETRPIATNAGGHEDFPPLLIPQDKRWKGLETNSQEKVIDWSSDGKTHRFEIAAVIGEKNTRPETGELAVYILPKLSEENLPVVIAPESAAKVVMTDDGWRHFRLSQEDAMAAMNSARRSAALKSEDAYWQKRHALARKMAGEQLKDLGEFTSTKLDRLIESSMPNRPMAKAVGDASFLKRIYLDVVGQVPTPEEQLAFANEPSPERRQKLIDKLLADPRRADAWMGYWQDLLAENPGILKPTLNNTGPFRYFLHEALSDNLPLDRFVTQLVRMDGSVLAGAAGGFSMASQNDSPMAAKAHIIAKAFLASELKCARCHDAPKHPYAQADLFELAALLAGKTLILPKSSSVAVAPGARVPAISISLEAGDKIEPRWSLSDISPEALPDDLLPPGASTRDRLAALLTWPGNRRFAQVMVNRVWAIRTGRPFVDHIDDWDVKTQKRFPEALAALATDFMRNGYDLMRLDRLILNSRYYQAEVVAEELPGMPLGPARRRLSAEQLVDSLFGVAGKPFDCEELCLDPEGRRPATEFINLGHPRHAWQMTSASNERDRPALGLPAATQITDLMQAFGWRSARQDPITQRESAVTPLQPGLLASGLVHTRIARASDDSQFTAIALKAESIDELADSTVRRVLARPASPDDIAEARALFADSFKGRLVRDAKPVVKPLRSHRHRVSWSNHLKPLATEIQIAEEAEVRAGDPPTARLSPDFREAYEDWVWALLNSPDFLFIP